MAKYRYLNPRVGTGRGTAWWTGPVAAAGGAAGQTWRHSPSVPASRMVESSVLWIRLEIKSWIRIHNESMRIHNNDNGSQHVTYYPNRGLLETTCLKQGFGYRSALFLEARSRSTFKKVKILELYMIKIMPWTAVDAHNRGVEAKNRAMVCLKTSAQRSPICIFVEEQHLDSH